MKRTYVSLLVILLLVGLPGVARAQTISTYAGGGVVYGDGGLATSAQLQDPAAIALDAAGNLYIGDFIEGVVRRVDAATGVITTIAGTPNAGTYTGDGGPATLATFGATSSLAFDAAGNLYIADGSYNVIRRVDKVTGIITTVAGGGSAQMGDGGSALLATLSFPQGIAVDAAGNLYIADFFHSSVRKVDAATGNITTIAGSYQVVGGILSRHQGFSGDNGPATSALLNAPQRLAVDTAGNVYLRDFNPGFPPFIPAFSVVRRIDAVTGIITTIAGGGASDGTSGLATGARLGNPANVGDIAVDGLGNLFIVNGYRAWKVVLATNAISVVAGTGAVGSSGDGGLATAATFNLLGGVTVSSDGSIYLCDAVNAVIRKIAAPPVVGSPVVSTITDGLSFCFNGGTYPACLPAPLQASSPTGYSTVGGYVCLWGGTYPNCLPPTGTASGSQVAASWIGGGVCLYAGTYPDCLPATGSGSSGQVASSWVGGGICLYAGTYPNCQPAPGSATPTAGAYSTVGGSICLWGGTYPNCSPSAGSSSGAPVSASSTIGGGVCLYAGTYPDCLPAPGAGGPPPVSYGSVGGSVCLFGGIPPLCNPPSNGANVPTGGAYCLSVGTSQSAPCTLPTGTASQSINAGSITLSTDGAATVAGTTGGGATDVTMVNGPATMNAVIPAGTFTSPVSFAIENLAPTTGPATTSTNAPVSVTTVAAYRFTFAIPTLNSSATLDFLINVGVLAAADQSAFLAALASSNLTIAVQGDAVGSVYQAFAVCAPLQLPAGGCAQVVPLDATKTPLLPGDPSTPAFVQFVGLAGHFSSYAVVIVSDTIAPVISGVPASFTVEATGPLGAIATYALPTANDAVSGPATVGCVPASGSTFPLGATAVACHATDASGNTATAGFTVTVGDTTAPVLANVPANTTVTATGASGAAVNWPAPTASDLVSGTVAVNCLPASGSTFPVATTTVTCTATDAAHNSASRTFTVTVQPQPTGSSRTICTTLGGMRLPDVDLFQFAASAGEKVTITLAANPAGNYVNGSALLALFGIGVLQTDGSTLPNVVSATLSKAGTYYVTVSELLLKSGKFTGAYCVTLTSTKSAWQTFVKR